MSNPSIFALILLSSTISAAIGYSAHIPPPCPKCPPPKACPINITGNISQSGGLFDAKKTIRIFFNGDEVLTGYLDNSNNADLHGTHNGKIATASCSGAETLKCLIKYDSLEKILTFNKK